jgi:hypothetical protein
LLPRRLVSFTNFFKLLRTTEPREDIFCETPRDWDIARKSFPPNNDDFLLVPRPSLISTTDGHPAQEALLLDLETVVKTMTTLFSQQLAATVLAQTPQGSTKRRFETLTLTPPFRRERDDFYRNDSGLDLLSNVQPAKRRRIPNTTRKNRSISDDDQSEDELSLENTPNCASIGNRKTASPRVVVPLSKPRRKPSILPVHEL